VFETLVAALGGSFARAPWGWGILALLIAAVVKMRPLMAELAAKREATLLDARAADNADLKHRVDELERRLDSERARHEAERSIDRHRINNLTQCLDALLLLLEAAPDKAAEHIVKIKDMRERQARVEAAEKAATHGAAIQGATQ